MRTKATRKIKQPCLATRVSLAQENYSVGSTHPVSKSMVLVCTLLTYYCTEIYLAVTVLVYIRDASQWSRLFCTVECFPSILLIWTIL